MQNQQFTTDNNNRQEKSREDALPQVATPGERKQFIEPSLSVPVDVLEATTFFQDAESGVTN